MDPHPLANLFKRYNYDEPNSSDLSVLDYLYEVLLEIRESENCDEEIPKPTEASTKILFHHRNLLFPRDPILGPFSASCRRGIRSWRASTSTLLPF